ncbi:hypothetical protein RUM43_008199 [Polyplax serrata]|uniref:MYND-type domain-containing protein n=1 Tax=Polyplax serrata TaxID=468196 RepID=A0AAN8PYI5_POLSC
MEYQDEAYRDTCSLKTLYSPKEGFFSSFITVLVKEIGHDWIETTFKSQPTDSDKIRICCSDNKVWPIIQQVLKNVSKVYRKKCPDAADQSRHQGDLCCKIGDFKRALMVYSQSIVRAPQDGADSHTLSLAYKGRATALYHLGRYKESIDDLNMALKEKLPDSLKYQVYWQMGKCHKKLASSNKGRISLQLSLKLLDEQIETLEGTIVKHGAKADKTKDVKLRKVLREEKEEIERLISELSRKQQGDKQEISDKPYNGGPLPEVTGTKNDRYPSASGLLKIRQSTEVGRFAAAADTIPVGATLVVEEPHASLLVPHMLSSHCHHCFTRLVNPVPCRTCSGVAFCTVRCRDEATTNYHRYECQLLGLFLGSGMSILSHLSLRMVTQEGLQFFKQLLSKVQTPGHSQKIEFTQREMQYMKVYNLMTHSRLRTSLDYFRRAIMAIFLVRCLKETDYFPTEGNPKDKFSEDEILTASVILRHLELLQFNAHEIYETRMSPSLKTRQSKAVYIGVGIYPTVALFNHECSPSVARYFNGKNIIIKAVRPMEKNEVLSENYGPHYGKKSLRDRTRELTSRYWFKCECVACTEDWPLIEDLGPDDWKLRCSTPKCPGSFPVAVTKEVLEPESVCWYCQKKTDIGERKRKKEEAEDIFNESLNKMDHGNYGEAIVLLSEYLHQVYSLCAAPCREMFLGQEALRTCFAQTGNVWLLDE